MIVANQHTTINKLPWKHISNDSLLSSCIKTFHNSSPSFISVFNSLLLFSAFLYSLAPNYSPIETSSSTYKSFFFFFCNIPFSVSRYSVPTYAWWTPEYFHVKILFLTSVRKKKKKVPYKLLLKSALELRVQSENFLRNP